MKHELEQTIAALCKQLLGVDAVVELTRPDEQFGDYATNIALQLAGELHKSPRQIAETLAVKIRENLSEKVADVAVAGPGFVNIRLADKALFMALGAQPAETLAGKIVVVEYSDPNPLKPLHAGHLYTTLVGDSIARLVEHAGAKTVRINYGGDVGLHVARSMWAIIRKLGGELPDRLPGQLSLMERATWLGARYVEGTGADEDDPTAHAEIIAVNKRVYQLHADNDHNSPFAHIYWTVRQWSYDYFAVLYEQLQVHPFDRFIPESEVTPLGVQAVQDGLARGIFTHSDGAIVFAGEQYDLHTRVFINSHGLPTYEAKDVGLSLTKWRDYHFDESIIITANEQEQYMQVVVAAIEQFAPEPAKRTRHLTHGVVKLQGGVKMSSRKGNIITALEILDAAREAGKETGTDPSEETILAAVKYAFARNRIGGDIVYDPKESIALEGNSGPYLQYAHARARSILGKARLARHPHENGDSAKNDNSLSDWMSDRVGIDGVLLESGERGLVRKISEYPEVVERATNELLPHYICTYLYELAQTFNSFYEHNRVIGDRREAVRLSLVRHYAGVLKAGLELLGITAPDKM